MACPKKLSGRLGYAIRRVAAVLTPPGNILVRNDMTGDAPTVVSMYRGHLVPAGWLTLWRRTIRVDRHEV
jgi:hypothetical protein